MNEHEWTIDVLGTSYKAFYIKSKAKASDFVKRLMAQPNDVYGLDIETAALPEYSNIDGAGLSPHLSKPRLLQLFTGRSVLVFDCFHTGYEVFTDLIEERRWVGQNSLFDLQYLYKWFNCKYVNIGCTRIAAKLLYHACLPTDNGTRASLEALAKSVLGIEIRKELQVSQWAMPELTFEQLDYSARDPIYTLLIAKKLVGKVQKLGMSAVYNLYKASQHPIAQLQLNGIAFNAERHRQMMGEWKYDLIKAKKEVQKITGLTKLTNTTIACWLEDNLPPDIKAVWPRTETEKLQTDSHALSEYADLPIVAPFSNYQKKLKLCTSFGEALLGHINPKTKRIHSHFNICGARTGRLSASEPNCQQYPHDISFRQNFIAPPGRKLVCCDFSQIELRVMAELCRDESMLKAYREGIDIHTLTASKITGKPISEIGNKSPERALGKQLGLGLLYGLGAKKFGHYARKAGVKIEDSAAIAAVKAYKKAYPGLVDWQIRTTDEAAETMQTRTILGKLRCLDVDTCYGGSLNTPCQGTAAEIMLFSLVYLDERQRNKGHSILCNCVHDEIIVECDDKEDVIKEVSKDVEDSMVRGYLRLFPNGIIKGLADAGSGYNWAEAKG